MLLCFAVFDLIIPVNARNYTNDLMNHIPRTEVTSLSPLIAQSYHSIKQTIFTILSSFELFTRQEYACDVSKTGNL